ncbi:hypothetical protein CCHR01_19925 [Colletotrichum chrysophilum]|uniref:Uncharacterized protein n=1 Tax=Colletotrichum chrysophilum TaxID=1836956 RepID=A0AAD9E7E6_9PEZI|nr:hypothetical protein CCHR01_19925 [Colletotrichum chrysophilum]
MTSKACPLRYSHLLPEPTPTPGPSSISSAIYTTTPKAAERLLSNAVQTMSASVQPTTDGAEEASMSPPEMLPSSRHSRSPSLPRYDSPQAIYGRYCAARSAWYAAQPRGSVKTNQEYRRAMGLPLRYGKKCYEWCIDYKQMNRRCTTSKGSRDWLKEEMMAYLDWDRAEQERVDELVVAEEGDNPFRNSKRGMGDIWKRVERDNAEQEALYSGSQPAECIVVKS